MLGRSDHTTRRIAGILSIWTKLLTFGCLLIIRRGMIPLLFNYIHLLIIISIYFRRLFPRQLILILGLWIVNFHFIMLTIWKLHHIKRRKYLHVVLLINPVLFIHQIYLIYIIIHIFIILAVVFYVGLCIVDSIIILVILIIAISFVFVCFIFAAN